VGIIYNSKHVAEEDVTGWELLWNEKYEDKILMFDNSRDAFCITQCMLGYDINTSDPQQLLTCAKKLAEQRPVVQQYIMDQVFDLMENEEAWIAPYYAGDYLMMAENNPDLAFFLPANQGFNLFVDAMCIPTCAREKAAAELFINFLCDPEIAAANMDWVGYSVPLSAAKEYMDPDMVSDPVSYPNNELLSRGSSYSYLLPSVTRFVESLFLKVRIGRN
jgi:spermidine/putrescine transport system substrate-binding protein